MCDVTQISSQMMSYRENGLLRKLCSLLDAKPTLEPQCAGYFSKVFQLLAHQHNTVMLEFWEFSGLPLLKTFLNHLGSYSIMEALRVILNLPVEYMMTCDPDGSEDTSDPQKPKWMQSAVVIEELIKCLTASKDPDVHEHVAAIFQSFSSEMMPRNDIMLSHLETAPSCAALIAVVSAGSGVGADEDISDVDGSARVSALMCLLQLVDAFLMKIQQSEHDQDQSELMDDHLDDVEGIAASSGSYGKSLPVLQTVLLQQAHFKAILKDQRFRNIKFTDATLRPCIGSSRRLITQLVSKLVIATSMGLDPSIRPSACAAIAASGLVPLCFDMFFKFDRCNIMADRVHDMLEHIVNVASLPHMEPILAALFTTSVTKEAGDSSAAAIQGASDSSTSATASETSNATSPAVRDTGGYGLLDKLLAEFSINAELEKAVKKRDRCKKGNFGYLQKMANMIVDADRLTCRGAGGADWVSSPLTKAVAANEKWRAFASVELMRINEVCGGAQEPQPGPADVLDDVIHHNGHDMDSSKDSTEEAAWYDDGTMEPKDETDDTVKLALEQMSIGADDAEDTSWAHFSDSTADSAAAGDTVTYDTEAAEFDTSAPMGADFTPEWDDVPTDSNAATASAGIIASSDGSTDAEFTPVWDDDKVDDAAAAVVVADGSDQAGTDDDSSWNEIAEQVVADCST